MRGNATLGRSNEIQAARIGAPNAMGLVRQGTGSELSHESEPELPEPGR